MRNLNPYIKEILEKLENHGFKAYVVGGYVRDFLLGKKSKDIDICTNAPIKEVASIFPGKRNAYGSFQMKIKEFNVDITTFREEKKYEKRRPIDISYTDDLKKDLKRRDFTINAICMDKSGNIIDEMGGVEDLKNKKIKMVGEPTLKLQEDPLRILRAIRFCTLLDFTLDENLAVEIQKQGSLLSTLSTYRMKEELSKILESNHFLKGLELLKKYHLCTYLGLSYTNIVFCHNLCGMWAQLDLEYDLPFTKQEKNTIVKIREILDRKTVDAKVIYTYGLPLTFIAGEILNIDREAIDRMYETMPIHVRKDLDILYEEIADILKLTPSKKVKEMEQKLIEAVLNQQVKNENKELKSYLHTNKSRWLD